MTTELEDKANITSLINYPCIQGKVRDIYDLEQRKLIVTSDRVSAFDKAITTIPFKGQVLNLVSRFWFEATASIMRNHMIAVPYANVMLVNSLKMIPVEFVVRAYLTGSTKTAIWTKYKEGKREFNGFKVPDGMKKNQRLPSVIVTPTIKSTLGDSPITYEEIIANGLMTQEQLEKSVSSLLNVFEFASRYAKAKDLILVDSKFELGLDDKDRLVLADELLTPDSSRYWRLSTYINALMQNKAPESYDKEILRLYIAKQGDPYKTKTTPNIPDQIRTQLSERYISFYEKLMGKSFDRQALNF